MIAIPEIVFVLSCLIYFLRKFLKETYCTRKNHTGFHVRNLILLIFFQQSDACLCITAYCATENSKLIINFSRLFSASFSTFESNLNTSIDF